MQFAQLQGSSLRLTELGQPRPIGMGDAIAIVTKVRERPVQFDFPSHEVLPDTEIATFSAGGDTRKATN
jgi:hypothetical protein